MKSIRWDKPFIKAIVYPYFAGCVYFTFEFVFADGRISDVFGFLFTLLLIFAFYVLFSGVGWLLLGLPSFALSARYFKNSYVIPVVVLLLFVGATFSAFGVDGLFTYGLAATAQVCLYYYFSYWKNNKSIKSGT